MRIGILIQDLYGRGAESAAAAIARGLSSRGVDVDLIVSSLQRHNELKFGKTGFALPDNANLVHLPFARARYNIFALRKYLRETSAAGVFVMSPSYAPMLSMAAIGLRHRPLIGYVIHGVVGITDSHEVLAPPKRFSFRWLINKFIFSRLDRVLCVSKAGARDFLRMNPFYKPENVFTVYNPVVDEYLLAKINCPPEHKWLVEKKCPTFVAAGQFDEAKGHFYIMDAIRRVNLKRPVRLIIFGEGPLKDEYQKFINENNLSDVVSLPGYTQNLPAEIKASDGFLHASFRESFGIVLVEALAAGVPVISTDAPFGPPEILESGRYGKLVPIKDAISIAKAIEEILDGSVGFCDDSSWSRFTVDKVTTHYLTAIGMN